MDTKDTNHGTERSDHPSLSSLMQLDDDGPIEDFDLGLQASESSAHLHPRSPGAHAGLSASYDVGNQELPFDTNGNQEMTSPIRNQKLGNNEGGDEELAKMCYLFGSEDRPRNKTPPSLSSYLPAQPDRSDVSGGGVGLDVDSFLQPTSVRRENVDERESQQLSPNGKVGPLSPKESKPSDQECQSHKLSESPCCANPQSPAASEHGSPIATPSTGTSFLSTTCAGNESAENDCVTGVPVLNRLDGEGAISSSLPLLKRPVESSARLGRQNPMLPKDIVLKVANSSFPSTPNQAPRVIPTLDGRDTDDADRSNVMLAVAPCLNPVALTHAPVARRLQPVSHIRGIDYGDAVTVRRASTPHPDPASLEKVTTGSYLGDAVSVKVRGAGADHNSTSAFRETTASRSGNSAPPESDAHSLPLAGTQPSMATESNLSPSKEVESDKRPSSESVAVNELDKTTRCLPHGDESSPMEATHKGAIVNHISEKGAHVGNHLAGKPNSVSLVELGSDTVAGACIETTSSKEQEPFCPTHETSTEDKGNPASCQDKQSSPLDSPQHADDQAFSESSDDSVDTEDESLCGSAYLDRARERRRRNEKLWSRVSGLSRHTPETRPKRNNGVVSKEMTPNVKDPQQPRGMLLPTSDSSISDLPQGSFDVESAIDRVYAQYPFRESQIKMLYSMMGTSVRQASIESEMIYTPAPIFVTGPSGAGKTSVVLDVLKVLRKVHGESGGSNDPASQAPLVGRAYVDCATIDPRSIDAVVESAFGQLVEDAPCKQLRQKKRLKRKHLSSERMSKDETDLKFAPNANGHDSTGDMEDRVEQERTASLVNDSTVASSEVTAPRKWERKAKACRSDSMKHLTASAGKKPLDGVTRQVNERTSLHAAPVAFGRALVPFFGRGATAVTTAKRSGCAFLVLDNGDRLLSLSASKTERNNFLAQLLLLPQVMGLNLTVVVVTRSTLLDCSRVNNVVPTQKSLGAIKGALRPIRVHFPAYRGKEAFKKILQTPKQKQLIVGLAGDACEGKAQHLEFRGRVYDSFLDVLLQSLSSSTRDVRDMIRLGRLWPTYIEPLHPSKVAETLETIRTSLRDKSESENGLRAAHTININLMRKQILTFLDQRILPRLRNQLEDGLLSVKPDTSFSTPLASSASNSCSSSCDLPYLSKCLLLAAFICQTNGPDKDHQLLTIQKCGTRSKRKRDGNREGGNFGPRAWENRHSTIRPRSFPLERMLSVFVNITGLLQGGSKLVVDTESSFEGLLQHLGTDAFFESLAELREFGLLREVGSSSVGTKRSATLSRIKASSAKYWCPLTFDEASEIAKSVDFPLLNFLI